MTTSHIELNNEIKQRGEDGFYRLDRDQAALDVFMAEVAAKTVKFNGVIDRLRYLVDNAFYYDVFADYADEELTEIHKICDSYNFRFASYMAASKFYKDYALKTNDKTQYLENYAQHVAIVALYLARGDYDLAVKLARSMMEQRYQPATPTFMNAGRARRGEMVSCFLLEMDDSLNSINYVESTAKQLSKIGGGVAINLSKLRARGEAIKGIDNCAKGVIPIAKSLEHAFAYCDQLGTRPGAGAAYLNIFHYDTPEFLDTKKINADEDTRLNTLSVGLIVPSLFFTLAERGEDVNMFAPHTVYRAYGTHLDDMNMTEEVYRELSENPAVRKRSMPARDLLERIAITQLQSGYPYLMFRDNANKAHALNVIGRVKMSNLCTEIFQLQETSVITDYGQPDVIRRDISCNLGSLNIVNVMETGKLRESVHEGMRALTAVSDMTRIDNAPGVRLANEQLHSVGLGVMNLHGFFAKNGIQYESEEARDFCRTFFAAMNFYSLEASCQIAKERDQAFEGFDLSDYASGTYFERYESEDFAPRTDKVAEIFAKSGIYVPRTDDWAALAFYVQYYGLYHAYRLAIAPTQSISYIQNATSSVMPIVEHIERRSYGNAETYYPMPFLSPQTQWFYKSAYNIDQYALIDLIAEIQPHIDQGISTILYVNSDISTRELARLYIYAHKRGLKSLYYTRNRLLRPEECTSCAI
ncbi:class 1b ribonucleoside-diphosphate reductase subunit alpha [Paenibacillus cisolokensis]|uniref:Ribonucleoside-diphosphate reductase n=1 Tax=Paenibacillus cisolokensis TaxID=1658519 RepID=A0ABQ4N685_9BACL|nr:class 1b ribonucleoside-diphosphate reductase subunit alpha [Paenibacillus cisolokensis]GIQ63672.1 class 1b ribonucleoside-diphosphate reductase subunit alpha [Paenibacillus cisolokensis]